MPGHVSRCLILLEPLISHSVFLSSQFHTPKGFCQVATALRIHDNTTQIRVYNTTERRLHTHTRNKNFQTPKKLRKNTRKPLPRKYYLPTTLDIYKQRHTPQRFTHFYISHTCSLSHRKPNAPSLRTRTHSKTLESDQPPPRTRSSEE